MAGTRDAATLAKREYLAVLCERERVALASRNPYGAHTRQPIHHALRRLAAVVVVSASPELQ